MAIKITIYAHALYMKDPNLYSRSTFEKPKLVIVRPSRSQIVRKTYRVNADRCKITMMFLGLASAAHGV